MLKRILIAILAVGAATAPAFAHLDPMAHGPVMAGFTHPLFGLDHVLVMVAVGLWAAVAGRRAIWIVPAAFVGAMAFGFAAAIAGVSLPFVEPVILVSVVFVGVMVALALPVPAPAVAAMVAVFALFHGHAHGGELGAAGALEFALGFIVATAALHLVGIALGLGFARILDTGRSRMAIQILGGLTALGGVWLAVGA
ncbi:HupE/UreJ family protein [Devosia nitrariae]|uniref:Urease accessory protein n=1 Tax=Devosia nitrariae TaxID=2071872 RepID=A0ABQ5W0V4_9HYPH|nr:HupE/UreJ family protein [Devosia nitrariae]GLQ53527.1 urease accessory protein [Devosia nitrariae]